MVEHRPHLRCGENARGTRTNLDRLARHGLGRHDDLKPRGWRDLPQLRAEENLLGLGGGILYGDVEVLPGVGQIVHHLRRQHVAQGHDIDVDALGQRGGEAQQGQHQRGGVSSQSHVLYVLVSFPPAYHVGPWYLEDDGLLAFLPAFPPERGRRRGWSW